jgi:hypothetical protein
MMKYGAEILAATDDLIEALPPDVGGSLARLAI